METGTQERTPHMNRRNFFTNIFAAICAILWPKKAELVIDDDKTYTFGQDDDTAFTFDTDSNNDGVTIDVYAEGFEGNWRKLTEEELKEAIFAFEEGSKEIQASHGKNLTSYRSLFTGDQWGVTFPKENEDARRNEST